MRRETALSDRATPRESAGSLGERRGTLAIHHAVLALALGLTFVAYCGSLRYEFVYDDHDQIVTHQAIRSWRFAPDYFTHHLWASIATTPRGNYYRPFFLLWLRVNYMLFGLRPWGWHLTSILAHLAVTFLVYVLAVKLINDQLTAAITALIFGLHPVHVEAISWISGVPECLLGLLIISSFLCYLLARSRGGAWPFAGALLLYSAALLTKETAVIFPVIIFSYEWLLAPAQDSVAGSSEPRPISDRIRRTVPFLAVTLVYLVARVLALHGLIHTSVPLRPYILALTWPSLIWLYLRVLLFPVGLSFWYDLPSVTRPGLLNFAVPVVGIGSLVLLLLVWARRAGRSLGKAAQGRLSRLVGFALILFLVPLIPPLCLSVIPSDGLVHDRYLYVPSVGFAVLASLALRSVFRWRRETGWVPAQVLALTLLAVLLSLGTAFQSLDWANDLIFYSHAVVRAPTSPNFRNNLGNALLDQGRYDDAIKLYQQALALDPTFYLAVYNLGVVHYRLGRLGEAEQYLRRAASVRPDWPEPLVYLGLVELRKGRLEEAAALTHQAVRTSPNCYGVHFARGMVLKLQGDLRGAMEEFQKELALNPEQQTAREQMAETEARLRSTERP